MYNRQKKPERRNLLTSWTELLERYKEPALITDGLGKIVMLNAPAIEILGRPVKKILGQKIEMFDGKIFDLAEKESRRKAFKDFGFYHGFAILKTLNNKEYLAEVNINKLIIPDNKYYIYEYIIDDKGYINDYKIFVKIKNEIYLNLRDIKLDTIIRKFNIPYNKILFLFKHFEPTPPKKYINNLKIEKCKEMINEGRYNYKEIAYELGFCDVSHLLKLFKERMHMTLDGYKNSELNQ